jgi:hypothetical protein
MALARVDHVFQVANTRSMPDRHKRGATTLLSDRELPTDCSRAEFQASGSAPRGGAGPHWQEPT